MKIAVKLYASLAGHLPDGAVDHRIELDVPEDSTPHQIIARFRVPREQAHLCLLNGVYLEPSERDRPVFEEGDTLAVWPPVAGGSD
jgi:sulfur-carrier protein